MSAFNTNCYHTKIFYPLRLSLLGIVTSFQLRFNLEFLRNIGDHFSTFKDSKIKEGHFESTSEAVRAGLRLLEAEKSKLDLLHAKLAEGEAQLDRGEGTAGEAFMKTLID